MSATLAVPSPALAKKKAPPPPPPAPVYVPSTPIDRFYSARKDAMLWMGSREAQVALVELLRDSPIDGFTRGPQLATEIEAKIAAAQGGDAAAAKVADRAMSQALVDYVQSLYQPIAGMEYGDNWVRPRAPTGESILALAARAPVLADHVKTVWNINPIYAQLRQAALAEAKLANGGQSSLLATNLSRARFKSPSDRYVVVDIVSQRLWMYQAGQPVGSMKVVVGKNEIDKMTGKNLQTPMIASVMYYTVHNPYWHVPDHLVKNIAKGVVSFGVNAIKGRYEVVSAWANDAVVLDPNTVDWKAAAAGQIFPKLRQRPSGDNSMGKMKFPFVNSEGIFLHDTEHKEYFAKSDRSLSNGCVRLEQAARLGEWLNQGKLVAPAGGTEAAVPFPQGVPVYITYLTARPEDGKIAYAKDIYGWDRAPRQVAAAAAATTSSTQ
ncbi:L,D-transpeptidase family protein [Sphingomonas jaspsi]|uniref:L,D-transpeptidase family protein n=1 Tax=Sphingomonas jaspsi TaxID=392409 RepID=UPI0009FFFB70|nr:L,D-transpeptidase family protein [Sphingomonas jaspsi]